jgi:hypothetical protein
VSTMMWGMKGVDVGGEGEGWRKYILCLLNLNLSRLVWEWELDRSWFG